MHAIAATTNAFLAPQALSLIIPPVPIFSPASDMRVFFGRCSGLRCVAIGRAAFVAKRRLAAAPSKPAPRRHEVIDAQIRDEISVMQGVMISDLRQNEHLVRLG